MNDQDTQTRMKHMIYGWMMLCGGLLAGVVILNLNNIYLRDELAKQPHLTMLQKHEVIKEYHADMTGETKWALRKVIGCTDKE